MSRHTRYRFTTTAFLAGFAIALPNLASAQAAAPSNAPDSAPASQVTSGQKITGHTRTHKARTVKTSPEQPAPATAQRVAPSERLQDEPNQVKEQVAPIPAAPVKPGSRPVSGEDTPRPQGG